MEHSGSGHITIRLPENAALHACWKNAMRDAPPVRITTSGGQSRLAATAARSASSRHCIKLRPPNSRAGMRMISCIAGPLMDRSSISVSS